MAVALALLIGVAGSWNAKAAPERVNLILLESDDHHPDLLGAIGGEVETPNIDRLAARGALFRNNVCQGMSCAPSRNSLLTAKYPHSTGVYHNRDGNMAEGVWTFPRALQRAGYHTALIGKNHFKPHAATRANERTAEGHEEQLAELGFDFIHAINGKVTAAKGRGGPGDDHYRDYLRGHGLLEALETDYRENRTTRFTAHASVLPEEHHHDTYIGTQVVGFVERYREERPFFLWVDFVAPHPPADAPEPYASMYDPAEMRLPFDFDRSTTRGPLKQATDDELRAFRAGYYGMITHLDAQVGRIVEALETSGRLENTIVVFAGDQGSIVGDHGKWGKGEFYRGSVSSPLVIAGPGVKPDIVVDHPVELVDLAPTFLEIAGAAEEDLRECHGYSLQPLLSGKGEYERQYAYAELHDEKMAMDERYKYVDRDEEPMLFEIQTDPRELENLAGTLPEVEERFKKAIADWLESTPPVLEPNPKERRR